MTDQMDSSQWAANKIIKIKAADLVPFDRNPRIHSDAQIGAIKKSIVEWGWTAPIVVDEANMVIAGHGRLLAAEELEIEEIPCIVAKGWTDQQKKAYVIADNKLYEKGEWDYGAVFSQMRELASQDFDISLIDYEMNLDNLSYTPNFAPSIQTDDVSADDVIQAGDRLSENFESRIRQPEMEEMICPHCGEEFEVRR